MLEIRIDSLACLTVFFTLGCAPEPSLELEPAPEPEPAFRVGPLVQAAGCMQERQIAIVVGGICPGVVDWAASPLFAGAPVGSALSGYCLYEYVGAGVPDSSVLDPVTVQHECDYSVLRSQSALPGAYSELAQDAFYASVGWVGAGDLGLPTTASMRSPVTIAVVDTVPSDLPPGVSPISDHGLAVGAIARDIACPGGSAGCAVKVEPFLGLPRGEGGTPDFTHGGYYGTQAELARGIFNAVHGAPAGSKLIINLSLGWDEGFPEDAPSATSVYDVLQFAHCKDALVIAAAGNRNDLCLTTPMLPAAWESEPAPSALRCGQLGVPGTSGPSPGYDPLLFAVGGTDLQGNEFGGGRPDAEPRLVATATHAAGGLTDTHLAITGTSASTAAVSGAAALLWSFDPTMTGADVVSALYESGPEVGRDADFVGSGVEVSTPIHRLDVCAAFSALAAHEDFSELSALLPSPLSCASASVGTVDWSSALDSLSEELMVFPYVVSGTNPCQMRCEHGEARAALGTGLSACRELPEPAEAFIHPLPGRAGCSVCSISTDEVGSASVYATLNEAYDFMAIDDVILTVQYADDRVSDHFRLGPVPLSSVSTRLITIESEKPITGIGSATMTIVFDDEGVALPIPSELIVADSASSSEAETGS